MPEGRQRTRALFLALLDAALVIAAMALAWWLRWDLNRILAEGGWWHPFATGVTPPGPYRLAACVAVPLVWLLFREAGLYRQPEEQAGGLFRLASALLAAAVLLAALGFFVKERFLFSRAYTMLFWPCGVLAVAAGRGLFRAAERGLWARGVGLIRVLFVGEGALAEQLAGALHERGGYVIAGTLSTRPSPPGAPPRDKSRKASPSPERRFTLKVLGPASRLVEQAKACGVEEVIVAPRQVDGETLRRLLEDCQRAHVRFRMAPGIQEMLLGHMDLSLLNGIALLGMRGSRVEGVNRLLKRLFDLAFGLLLAVLLSPLLALIALVLALREGRPVLYNQRRVGFRGRPFRLWKFRTMRPDADRETAQHEAFVKDLIRGTAAPMDWRGGAKKQDEGERGGEARDASLYRIVDDPRVTPLGKFLRRYGLDEWPQLWNVLRGEMSLIGPRPPLPYEVEQYRPLHLRRLEVRPGISGLWQVSGHHRLSFEQMIELDLYYLENWSLGLDLYILLKTPCAVLFQKAR